ncbi:MAG: hypothetical protein F9K40_11575 [Kofleriaceae bacterium]|nr:MAG: hypothetical protein F9K40_11575 [Kofleriaceae bacterium]MBZ0238188.1 hypothetical protein [Kofleriaceae bacterium]
MSPRKPTPEHDESATEAPARNRPGERQRDEERDDRGVVYHGADWDRADEEHERGALDIPAEEEVASDIERGDEEITDPGTRGSNFGKGGKGIVQRDEPIDE